MTLSNPIRSLQPRFARFGQLVMAALCVSVVSLAAAPKAMAAAPNGNYEFKEASGSLKIDGDSYDLPESLVKRIAGVVDGEIAIRDNTLNVKKNATAKIVERVADDAGLNVDVQVKGPNKVVLTKSGSTYSGSTSSAIVTTFDGKVFGVDYSGKLLTRVSATVVQKKLTVVIRFSGSFEGEDFSGKVTIVARR